VFEQAQSGVQEGLPGLLLLGLPDSENVAHVIQ
jgi:hypothetical protein